MGKKIIFLADYLNRKKGIQPNQVAPKEKVSPEEDLPINHVIDMKAYLQSKNVSLEKADKQSDDQPQESVDNIVAFKKHTTPATPSDKEIFVEENNVVFMGDYFKRKKIQKELERGNPETPASPLTSYGAAAAFLAVLTLSVLLFQGERTHLALESGKNQAPGRSIDANVQPNLNTNLNINCLLKVASQHQKKSKKVIN